VDYWKHLGGLGEGEFGKDRIILKGLLTDTTIRHGTIIQDLSLFGGRWWKEIKPGIVYMGKRMIFDTTLSKDPVHVHDFQASMLPFYWA